MNSLNWQLELAPSQVEHPRKMQPQTLTVTSTLVNDVLMQIAKLVDGNYQGADYFSLP